MCYQETPTVARRSEDVYALTYASERRKGVSFEWTVRIGILDSLDVCLALWVILCLTLEFIFLFSSYEHWSSELTYEFLRNILHKLSSARTAWYESVRLLKLMFKPRTRLDGLRPSDQVDI